MDEGTMATLPNDYLNMLFQKEEVFDELVESGVIDIDTVEGFAQAIYGNRQMDWLEEWK